MKGKIMAKKIETAQAQPGTNVATQDPNKEQFDTLRAILERSKQQIAKAMPSKMDVDRLIRISLTVCQRQPKLLQCHPVSIVGCTMLAAELGLELSGPLGQAYMVPRRNKNAGGRLEATFQVGYRGFYHLAYNSGRVSSFQPRVVHANDEFFVSYGTNSEIQHRPKMTGDAGPAVGYYCVVNLLPSGQDFEYMTHQQMLEHRKRFAADNQIWDSDFEPMALKTVVRRVCKRLPVSTTLVKAALFDEYEEAGVTTYQTGGNMADATANKLTALRDKLAESGIENMLPEEAAPSATTETTKPVTETKTETPAPDAPPSEKGHVTATEPPKQAKEGNGQKTGPMPTNKPPKATDEQKLTIAKLTQKARLGNGRHQLTHGGSGRRGPANFDSRHWRCQVVLTDERLSWHRSISARTSPMICAWSTC
jgi:recombination protein RecT